jgi:hypothetical protein
VDQTMDKKQMIKEYKQTPPSMGVYIIKNQQSDHIFIGSSMDLDKIINRHLFELRLKSHQNKKLQEEWNQYGKAQLDFQIVEKIKPEEEVILDNSELVKYKPKIKKLEEKWIEKYKREYEFVIKL